MYFIRVIVHPDHCPLLSVSCGRGCLQWRARVVHLKRKGLHLHPTHDGRIAAVNFFGERVLYTVCVIRKGGVPHPPCVYYPYLYVLTSEAILC